MRQFLFVLFFVPFFASAQINGIQKANVQEEQIGKIDQMGWKYISLKRVNKDSAIYFHLSFKDERYRQLSVYKSIIFGDVDNVIDTLYANLKTAIESADKYEISFELGRTMVVIKKVGSEIWFSSEKGLFVLNRRQLDKLFNK